MATAESGTIAVLAEKPSVARDIARVLGATTRATAICTATATSSPGPSATWWRWRSPTRSSRNGGSGGATCCPCCPIWPLVVYEKTKDQFEVVRKILNSPRISRVVCATDAGREGELIFRYIYEAARLRQAGQPAVDLVAHAGRHPQGLRRAAARRRLRSAGRCRARAQPRRLAGGHESLARLLAGVSTRSFRSAACRRPRWPCWSSANWPSAASCPRTTWKCMATFHPAGTPKESTYQGTWFREPARRRQGIAAAMRLPADGEEAARIVERARTGQAAIESIEVADPAHAAAAALRPDRAAAARQPPLRLQRAEDAGHRPGAVRTPQADQLSAHRQPPSFAGRGGHAAADRQGDRGALSRAPRARHRRAAARPALRRRCQGHRPPRHHPHHRLRREKPSSPPTSARSTT